MTGKKRRGRPAGKGRSRRKILDAALVVFSRKGFHKARMDEISEQAGVAKGTLYYNFPSKSRIFSAMVTEGMETIIETVRGELKSDLRFPDHFRKLIEVNMDLHEKYRDLFMISFQKPSRGIEPAIQRRINEVRGRYAAFIEELLLEGQSKGYLRKVDARFAAVAILGMLDSLNEYFEKTPNPLSHDKMVDQVYAIMSAGLLASTANRDNPAT